MTLTKRQQANLALIINTIIWGAALPVVKPALSYTSPYLYLLYRYVIGSLLTLPLLVYLIIKHRPSPKQIVTIVILESLILVVGHSLLYYGLTFTSSLESSLIGISSPIFITIGSVLFLHEKEERNELIGFLIALFGTLTITLEPLLNSQTRTSGSLTGNLFVVSYVICWTLYNLLAKKLYPKIPKFLITTIGMLGATIGMTFVVFSLQPEINSLQSLYSTSIIQLSNPSVLIASLYMAVLGTIIAIPAYNYGLSKIEASEATLFTYLQPLVSIPLAVLWLHEPFKFTNIIGLALIGGGVFLAERRKTQ